MNPRTRVLTIAATAATLTALAVGPAAAAQASYDDPADATASLTDIRQVIVKHGADRVAVKVGFTDLRRTSDGGPSSLAVLIDTRAARSGPEFRLTSGLQSGTDYQLVKVRDGEPVGEPLTCGHHVRLDFAADQLVFHADRSCLGTPARLRIGVRMTDEYDSSHPVTDWLGQPRSWTDWLLSD